MKKIILAIICAVASIGASAQDSKLTVNAGFLFPSTLNATVGYERSFTYGNAVEVYGEIGNHWKSGPGRFWKGYYWDGGLIYKHRLHRYKNGSFRGNPSCCSDKRKFSNLQKLSCLSSLSKFKSIPAEYMNAVIAYQSSAGSK